MMLLMLVHLGGKDVNLSGLTRVLTGSRDQRSSNCRGLVGGAVLRLLERGVQAFGAA